MVLHDGTEYPIGPRSPDFWYSAASAVLMLAGTTRWALTESLNHALDQGLRHRLIGLHDFLEENSRPSADHLTAKLRDLEILASFSRFSDPRAN